MHLDINGRGFYSAPEKSLITFPVKISGVRTLVTSVLCLTAAVALTTTASALLTATVLFPFPYQDTDRIGFVWASVDPKTRRGVDRDLLGTLIAQSQSLQRVEYFDTPASITVDTPQQSLTAIWVSRGLFSALSSRLINGHSPSSMDEVLLSRRAHLRLFGTEIAGGNRTVNVSGERYRVSGLVSDDWFFPDRSIEAYFLLGDRPSDRIQLPAVHVLAIVKPGVQIEQVQQELRLIAQRNSTVWRPSPPPLTFHRLNDVFVRSQRHALVLLGAVCLLIVLLAAGNVGQLEANRISAITSEIAIKIALGSSTTREMSAIAMRLVAISAAATLLGVGIGHIALERLKAGGFDAVHGLHAARMTGGLALAGFIIALAAIGGFSLVPIRRIRDVELPRLLLRLEPGYTRRHRKLPGRGLIILVVHVALSLLLAGASAVLLVTFRELIQTKWGFNPAGVTIVSFSTSSRAPFAALLPSIESVLTELRTTVGVEGAAISYTAPFVAGTWKPVAISVDGQFRIGFSEGALYKVSGGHFDALGTKTLSGRTFPLESSDSEWAAVISEKMAKRLWPGEPAVGKSLHLMRVAPKLSGDPSFLQAFKRDESVLSRPGVLQPDEGRGRTVIGVVEDVYMAGLDFSPAAAVYIDYRQQYQDGWMVPTDYRLVVRANKPHAQVESFAKATILSNIPSAVVRESQSLHDLQMRSIGATGTRQLTLVTLSTLAAVAIMTMFFGVLSITREILLANDFDHAVALALGATVWRLRNAIALKLIAYASIGVACGLFALALSYLMARSYLPVPLGQIWTSSFILTLIVLVAFFLALVLGLRRLSVPDPAVLLRR